MSVELPSHEHGLTFIRDVSQNCSLRCNTCDSPVKGCPAYHCLQCRVVYHKSCADPAPLILRHPFHPAHPLVLRDKPTTDDNCSLCGLPHADKWRYYAHGVVYQCELEACGVWIHGVCAAATANATVTLPPSEDGHEKEEEEEDAIRHFAHPEHPLKSFVVNEQKNLKCKACRKIISGRIYGCLGCVFMLHESCAHLPLELQEHSFLPRHHLALQANSDDGFDCKACRSKHKGFAYCCKECDFIIGLCCATSVLSTPHAAQNFDDSGPEAYRRISTPNDLTPLQATTELLQVSEICWENISGDILCRSDFLTMLHKSCAYSELSWEIVLPVHPEHPFIFRSPDDTEGTECVICNSWETWFDIPLLKCKECPILAHFSCTVELLSAVRAGMAPVIQNTGIHSHQMMLAREFGISCTCCSFEMADLCYECPEYGCLYQAHIECATAKSTLEHPLDPQHLLILHEKPPREYAPCNACLMPFYFIDDSNGRQRQAAYCCDVCDLQMHTQCAMQKLRVKHPRHEHDLTYFELIEAERLLCNICFEKCSIDLYRCAQCNYNLHHWCMYLPPDAVHKDHIHPMVLLDRFILSNLRLDDQYCDLCETIRDPDHGVYYCDICEFAAHIDCVIPIHEVGQQKLLEDLAIANLDKEIASEYTRKEKLMADMEELKEKLKVTMKKLESLENRRQQIISSKESALGNE